MLRFGFAIAAILIVTLAVQAWNPPFPYRQGYVPARAIVARVPFEVLDEKQTDNKRAQLDVKYCVITKTILSHS